MTKDEIMNMPAGAKMNQLIWWKIFDMIPTPLNNDMKFLPDYSGEMSPAWSVAERINKMIFDGKLTLENDYNYLTLSCVGMTTGYAVSFDCLLENEWYDDITNYKYAARAETAPLAICRAALLAVVFAKGEST